MRSSIIAVALMLTVCTAAFGFSGRPVEVACRICSKLFMTTEKQSLFYWGSCSMCPYCLYSAMPDDFNTPTEEEIADIRETLGDLRPALEQLSRDLLDVELQLIIDSGASIGPLISMECYRQRGEDPRPPAPLVWLTHSSVEKHYRAELRPPFRRLAITRIEEGLSESVFPPEQSPKYTLLLGEIYLLEGDTDRALMLFDRAKELVAASPRPERLKHILRDIDRHAAAIVAPHMTTEELGEALDYLGDYEAPGYESALAYCAAEELFHRNDAEAWAAIVQGTGASARHLRAFLGKVNPSVSQLQQSPELWENLQQAYAAGSDYQDLIKLIEYEDLLREVNGDDPRFYHAHTWAALEGGRLEPMFADFVTESESTIEELAEHCRTSPGRLRELNDHFGQVDLVPAGATIRHLNTPAEWPAWRRDEDHVVQAMWSLMRAGQASAVDYFTRWLETIDHQGIELTRMHNWLDDVRSSPSLWPVLQSVEPTLTNTDQRIVWDCILLSCGSAEETAELFAQAKPRFMALLEEDREWNQLYVLILDVMEERKDDSAKEWALRRCVRPPSYRVTPYLTDVCDVSDIPALERAALSLRDQRNHGGTFRAYIERVIRSINLRELQVGAAD